MKLDKKRMLCLLQTVPKGKVVTYGDLAESLGNIQLSRAVGSSLHTNTDGDKYPCYKVVDRNGKLSASYAFGGIDAQQQRLESDGIVVIQYKVDLSKYRFSFNLH